MYVASLICQRLMFASKWRADLNVTLSALELLTGMAELDARFIGKCVHIIR